MAAWRMLLATLAVITLAGAEPAVKRYAIESTISQEVTGILKYDISCKNLQATEWIIFTPVAPELPSQTKLKTTIQPSGVVTKEQSPLGRQLLMARMPVKKTENQTDLSIQVTYQATLRSRNLKIVANDVPVSKAPVLTAADRRVYLADLGDFDFQADSFKKWLTEKKFARQANESDIDFARRVFLGLRASLTYEYRPDMNRKASAVCRAGKSDCGGMSALFVAIMRANKVPARALFGRWAKSAQPNEKIGEIDYFQWHAKAEFFADGVGWVPVDVSLAVLFDKSDEGMRFFGADAGDFITVHIDPNLTVNAVPFGLNTLHNMQQPAWWAVGKGSTTPAKITEGWQVRQVAR